MIILTGVLAAAAASIQPTPSPNLPLEEIVVTGRRFNSVALDPPVAQLQRFCFDPGRRTGRFAAPPADDPHWQPLGEEVRAQVGIADPEAVLSGLVDHVRRHRLILRLERLARPGGLTEQRCSLVVIGGTGHEELQAGMAALFRGPGTSRHVGDEAGAPSLPGWRHHIWSGMPQRGSRAWRDATTGAGRPGGGWIVVTDRLSFYSQYDYVLGDLKTRTGGPSPISILSIAHTSRTR